MRGRSGPDDRDPTPEPTVHRSLAFELLLERLAKRSPRRILDLGPAVGENVTFLSALPSKLFIADLPHALAGARDGESFDVLLERDFPQLGDRPVDAVLAWDLLNYLGPPQIESLGRYLAGCCRPGALLFALLSTQQQLPARPQTFRIHARDELIYEPRGRHRRTGPRYTEPELRRALPDFDVDVTFLLRNGMQEYLFTRLGAPGAAP